MKITTFLSLLIAFTLLFTVSCSASNPPTSRPAQPTLRPQTDPTASTPPTLTSSQREAVDRILGELEQSLEEMNQAQSANPDITPFASSPNLLTQELEFVQYVADDVNAFWPTILAGSGYTYRPPKIKRSTQPGILKTPCGEAETSDGWFYCSIDETVYYVPIDQLRDDIKPPQDYGLAIIISHEFAHHLQKVFGHLDEYHELRSQLEKNSAAYNRMSVLNELQADCYAGVWSHSVFAEGQLKVQDILGAILFLQQVGDDALGEYSTDRHTHGTSEQRLAWYEVGYYTGNINLCATWTSDGVPPEIEKVHNLPQGNTNQPAPQNTNPIIDFFTYASDTTCQVTEDQLANTVQTRRCQIDAGGVQVTVDYDLWDSTESITNYLERDLLEYEDTWTGQGSNYGGRIVAFYVEDDLIIAWDVTGKNLTGTIYWYNDDLNAALDWWGSTAAKHKK